MNVRGRQATWGMKRQVIGNGEYRLGQLLFIWVHRDGPISEKTLKPSPEESEGLGRAANANVRRLQWTQCAAGT